MCACMCLRERHTEIERQRVTERNRERDLNQAFTYRSDKFCGAVTRKEAGEMTTQMHLIYENMLVSWSVGQNNSQQVTGMPASGY